MLAGVVRELSHCFSHSWSSYIQKWSLDLQDQEIGQAPGRGEGVAGSAGVLGKGGSLSGWDFGQVSVQDFLCPL